MDIHPYATEYRSQLGSKSYIFIWNDKIISLTNLFQYLLSAEILSEWKLEFIAAPQGGFRAPHVWEIVGRKNLTVFKGCHYCWFYIMIPLSFWEIETKNLNSDPRILISLVLGTISPADYELSKH